MTYEFLNETDGFDVQTFIIIKMVFTYCNLTCIPTINIINKEKIK